MNVTTLINSSSGVTH